jgi:DNA-binding transcriptional MerR regulator
VEKSPDAFRTISEVAEELNVPQHVLRFWESRFREIKPLKRGGGRRYYRPDDIGLLRGIHHLLYGEGYTIRGVQRILRDQGVRFVQTVWQPGAPRPAYQPSEDVADDTPNQSAEAAHDESSLPRLAPSLIPPSGGDASGRSEPVLPSPAAAVRGVAPVPVAPVRGLAPEDSQRLTSVLQDLGECRKLLDRALDERP